MKLTVYLAGEIHTDWRDELIGAVQAKGLDIEFVSPQLNHDLSDGIGEQIKGCLLYTSPSPRDGLLSRMPSSA